jgi:tetratricopeptide (TPR) repeat protein
MQIHTYLGITYERMHQPASAEDAFREAIVFNRKLVSPEPGILMQFAKFLQDEQRGTEAQEVINEILKFAPSFGLAHLERAKFLAELQRMEEALVEGELALKYAGTDPARQRAAHAFLARAYYALGRAEDAKLHQRWIESQRQR